MTSSPNYSILSFQECISKSAITTKFESHASRGKGITSQLRLIMEQVVGRAYSQRFVLCSIILSKHIMNQ